MILRLLLCCATLQLTLLPPSLRAQMDKVATGKRIMIAAHPLAAQAGLDIYRKGGNVVDVAVAAAYCLGVVEPHGSGIGGEGMMLIYDAGEDRYVVVDFKATAPERASYEVLDYAQVGDWRRTIRGASVPGTVAGLELAREEFGRLDRKTVLQPAVEYALHGYRADSTLVANLAVYQSLLRRDPHARQIYFPGDTLPSPGTVLRNPEYGRTLQKIQDGGAEAFYRGSVARMIAADMELHGGLISLEDLGAYKALLREPLSGTYRGYSVVTTPPPCGGMHLLEALEMLKFFDLEECRRQDGYSYHILAEVFKLMFEDEATLNGDPNYVEVPDEVVSSGSFAFGRLLEVSLGHARHPARVDADEVGGGHTTQLSVMDREGNAVSLTTTLSSLFGTSHSVEEGGFFLNNEMQNYSPSPEHPNALRSHKRVVTSLVPTILSRENGPEYALGTPGGDLILSTVAQVIVNLLDYRMSLEEAVFAPRMFSTFYQREMEMEPGFSAGTRALLDSLGHELKLYRSLRASFGAVQAVGRDPGRGLLLGVSDPRRSGNPRGE
jgi:gamma-glutamyltranspeptidase/glutathione hydrolase